MKMTKKKKMKWKALPLHKDAKKPRFIVMFYNDPRIANRLSHGYHHFEIGVIGYKWVKIRPSFLSTYRENHWTKIKRSKWDEIQSCKTFKVLEVLSNLNRSVA